MIAAILTCPLKHRRTPGMIRRTERGMSIAMHRTAGPGARRAAAALLLFVAVLGTGRVLRDPAGRAGGPSAASPTSTSPWARSCASTAPLGLERDEPSPLRPPGYPAFVAAVLWALVDSPARLEANEFQARGRRAVALCQAVLLAMAAGSSFPTCGSRGAFTRSPRAPPPRFSASIPTPSSSPASPTTTCCTGSSSSCPPGPRTRPCAAGAPSRGSSGPACCGASRTWCAR